jgi:hypothetical protein
MLMSEREHREWHASKREVTPEGHKAMMERMDVTEGQDRKWHAPHGGRPSKPVAPDRRQVNPYAIGGGFLAHCVSRGWLVKEGKGRSTRYFVTEAGRRALKRYGIKP